MDSMCGLKKLVKIVAFLQPLFAGCLTSVRNCPQPVPPPNGHVVYHNERSSYVMFRCDPEYELQGSRSALCMFGRWSPPPPKCVSREYARRGTEGTTATEVIRAPVVPRTTPCPYSEKKSLTLDVQRRSAEDRRSQFGSFFGCRLPPAPRYGYAVVRRNNNQVGFYCQRGFRLTSVIPMTCSGRVWNGTPPRCLNGTDSPQDDVLLETLRPNPCGNDYGGCAQMCLYGPDHHHACICQSGYSPDGTECIDRDECAEGKHNCEKGCVNTPGSYRCQCPDGYKLGRDNKSCLDIDECQANNGGCREECINHDGSFSCRCTSTGFSLAADGKTCVYTRARQQPRNPCAVNNGGCPDKCLWDGHTVTCSCPAGYRFDRNYGCVDVDECSETKNDCQWSCLNTQGGYLCQCPVGFKLDQDNKSCVDVDECRTNNGGCQESCVNIHGSFRCRCTSPRSFLAADGKNCMYILAKRKPLNPCDVRNGGCRHNCSWNGIKVTCSCPPGYRLNQYNRCTDAKVTPSNPCNVNNGGCPPKCRRIGRRVICSCPAGFYHYNKRCIDIDVCRRKNGGCQHHCFNTRGSYVCKCFEGYKVDPTDKKKCRDIDECSDGNFRCSHLCQNVHGSAFCFCPSGLNLAGDNKTCVALNGCSNNDGKGPCQERCTPSPNNGYSCSCTSPETELSADGLSCDKLPVVDEDTYENIWRSNSTGFSNSSDGTDDIEGSGREEDLPSGRKETDRVIPKCLIGFAPVNGRCQELPVVDEDTHENIWPSNSTGFSNSSDGIDDIEGSGMEEDSPSGKKDADRVTLKCPIGFAPVNGRCQELPVVDEDTYENIWPSNSTDFSNSSGEIDDIEGSGTEEGSGMEEESPSGKKDADRVTPKCRIGLAPVNGTCQDRDECAEGRHYCEEGCVNTPGSYRCQCPDGYELGWDNKSCLDNDECQANNGGCQEECINHVGSFSCRCTSPGSSLTANGQTCVAVTCPPLKQPEHGYIVGECTTTYRGKCVFECDEGFELTAQGSEIRTCQENGTWSGVTSQCVVKRCGEPPTPVNGYVRGCQEDSAVGTSCTIRCDEGYRLVGESTTACTSSKTWTVAEPICNLAQCPSPASLTRTARFLEHGLNRTYVYKDTFRPRCLSGFRLRGPRLIMCGANGQWEAPLGQSTLFNCVDKEEPVIRCPDNITLSVGAGRSHATVAWSQPEARDNSRVPPEIQQEPENIVSPWRFPIGQTVIRFRATDAARLWTECTFTVTVTRE